MQTKLLPLVGLLALAPTSAPAQTTESNALHPVLSVFREDVKPGRMGAHGRMGASFAAIFAKANPDIHYLGLTSVTGSSVVLYLEGHPSFAAAEQNVMKMEAAFAQNVALRGEMERLDSQNGDLVQSTASAFFILRPALSYRIGTLSDVAKARLMAVTTYKIKPGRIPDWIDYVKTLNAAREKAGASWLSAATYQSATGAPAGTFLTFRTLRSLAELDEDNAKAEERQKAIDAALGGDQVVKMRRDLVAEIMAEASTTNVFAVSRDESRPSAQFAAYDPDYWTPKTAAPPSKALATKKEAPKP